MSDRISRDELGLQLARTWARRGTCGRRQVGCVLLDRDSWPMGSGYNGPASGEPHCSVATPCHGFGAPSGTKLDACESIHAEINALSRCRDVREIHTCYLTCSPCGECVKALLNTGCRRIVFGEEYAPAHAELARGRWERAGREWVHLARAGDAFSEQTDDVLFRASYFVKAMSSETCPDGFHGRALLHRLLMTGDARGMGGVAWTASLDLKLNGLTSAEFLALEKNARGHEQIFEVTIRKGEAV
jgi:dCMP deaminase